VVNPTAAAQHKLGPDDEYLWRTFPDVKHLGQPVAAKVGQGTDLRTQPIWLIPDEFERHVQDGYQATATWNQGTIYDPGSNRACSWQYSMQAGWGNKSEPQQSTAGWLSFCRFLNQAGRF